MPLAGNVLTMSFLVSLTLLIRPLYMLDTCCGIYHVTLFIHWVLYHQERPVVKWEQILQGYFSNHIDIPQP